MRAGYKKRFWVHIAVALGVVTLLAVFIIVLNADINKRDLVIIDTKQQLELRNRTIELLSNSNSDLEKAEPLTAKLQSILPSKDQLISFPSELSQNAKGYGVDFGFNFGPEQASTPEEPGSIKFTMTLGGDFNDLIDFMGVVERHNYYIKLDSIDIRRGTLDGFTLLTTGIIYTN